MAVDSQKVAEGMDKCIGKLKDYTLKRLDNDKGKISSSTTKAINGDYSERGISQGASSSFLEAVNRACKGLYATLRHQDEAVRFVYTQATSAVVDNIDDNGDTMSVKISAVVPIDLEGDTSGELARAVKRGNKSKLQHKFTGNLKIKKA